MSVRIIAKVLDNAKPYKRKLAQRKLETPKMRPWFDLVSKSNDSNNNMIGGPNFVPCVGCEPSPCFS